MIHGFDAAGLSARIVLTRLVLTHIVVTRIVSESACMLVLEFPSQPEPYRTMRGH